MTSLDVAWRPLTEGSSGDTFVVSPERGSLYIFPADDWGRLTQAQLEAIGCHARERVADIPGDLSSDEHIPEYVERLWLWTAAAKIGLASWGWRAHVLGIRRTLAGVRSGKERRSPRDILRDIKSAEGAAHGHECLPRAVARWSALVRAGFEPTLLLGVAVPAARLHAWTTLDGVHLGEDPDEIVQYEPAVSYAAALRSP